MSYIKCKQSNYKKNKKFIHEQLNIKIKKNYKYLKSKKKKDYIEAFHGLLLHVQQNTDLITPDVYNDHISSKSAMLYLDGLRNLSSHSHQWKRSFESWKPKDTHKHLIFRSLCRHLMTIYPVPAFWDYLWLDQGEDFGLKRKWYCDLGSGLSFRRLNIPLKMTRTMEHYFLKSPTHYTLEQAMRYAQVLGLGGSKELAEEITKSRLVNSFEHNDFWREVLQFFINHPEIELHLVNDIIDFIYNIKFETNMVRRGDGFVDYGAIMPNFSIKGRTVNSLFNLINNFSRIISKREKVTKRWNSIGLKPFIKENIKKNGENRIWTITELLTSIELKIESKFMNNCVNSYIHRCLSGYSSIWSMQVSDGILPKKVMTIEVDPINRTVYEAKLKCNKTIFGKPLAILRQWAEENKLRITDKRQW